MKTMRARIADVMTKSESAPHRWGAPREVAEDWADAILDELREPDAAMVEAGLDCGPGRSSETYYRAMIDAAR